VNEDNKNLHFIVCVGGDIITRQMK
jgi:hypothetical protein